jgi:hypothetical protein
LRLHEGLLPNCHPDTLGWVYGFFVADHYRCEALTFRAFSAVGVKIATQKVSISTLTTSYLKNTPTIISIPLFIFLK